MALAYLAYRNQTNANHQFEADIGTNEFFQLKVGKYKRRHNGIETIDQTSFETPILRLKKHHHVFDSRFTLPVPASAFQNGNRYVQLWSYRTPEKMGPAISNVLTVRASAYPLEDLFPSLTLSQSTYPMNPYSIRNSAFSYEEQGISESMFWNQLIGALPGIVEKAVPMIANIVGSSGSGSEKKKSAKASEDSNALLQTIARLIQSLMTNNVNANNGTNAKAVLTSKTGTEKAEIAKAKSFSTPLAHSGSSQSLISLAQRCISKDTMDIIRDNPKQMAMVLNDSMLRLGSHSRATYPHYSEATVAWAPIIAAVAPIVKDVLELGIKNDEAERKHLENLVKLLNDPALTALMATLSDTRRPVKFTPEPKIYIDTSHLTKVRLHQKERVVYHRGHTVTIPFKLATSHKNPPERPIPRVIVQAIIQDTETMAVLWQKEFRVKDVFLNDLISVIEIQPEEAENLPANEDLKLEITALWQGKKSKDTTYRSNLYGGNANSLNHNRSTYGAVKNQYITLIDAYVFDSFGKQEGASVPLNDIVAHRPFWHKIWQGGFSESRRWHIEFDTKYYFTLDPHETEPAHLETRVKISEDNARDSDDLPSRRKLRAKLKAGIELTLEMLNGLLPSQGHPTLQPSQLAGLRSSQFKKQMNQAARVHLELKGRGGDTGAIWIYPEIDIHQIHLVRVDEVDEQGQVTKLSPETIFFPRPASIHFIGLQSD